MQRCFLPAQAACGRCGGPWHGWSALPGLPLVLGVAGSIRGKRSGVGWYEPPDVEKCGEMILGKVKV